MKNSSVVVSFLSELDWSQSGIFERLNRVKAEVELLLEEMRIDAIFKVPLDLTGIVTFNRTKKSASHFNSEVDSFLSTTSGVPSWTCLSPLSKIYHGIFFR